MKKPTIRDERGFSLIELLVVIGIVLVLTTVGIVQIPPMLRAMRADTSLTYVQNQIRGARQRAIDERRQYRLNFVAPRTMSLDQGNANGGPLVFTAVTNGSINLPFDMQFGLPPTKPVTPPDGYGTQANAIDFSVTGGPSGGTVIYFNPDGSVVDNLGGITNGVVYLVRLNDQSSCRAVSLFGATGRVKSWRIGNPGGTWKWLNN